MQIQNSRRTWLMVASITAAIGLGGAGVAVVGESSRAAVPARAHHQERIIQSAGGRDEDEPLGGRTDPVIEEAREGDWLTTRLWEYVASQ